MILHVLGLPHTQTNVQFTTCAFTMEIIDFCKMMKSLGHTIIHYGNEGSDPVCDELVTIFTKDEFRELYGERHFTIKSKQFYDLTNQKAWSLFRFRVLKELSKRIKKPYEEFILGFWGADFKPFLDAKLGIFVEAGVGYEYCFARNAVFRSYFWMAFCLNFNKHKEYDSWTWSAIPSFFDPDMYEYSDQKEDYYLYIARLIPSKGTSIITQLAEATGIKIKVAGQGDVNLLELDSHPNIEYVGVVGVEERKKLYKGAIATFLPTLYMEPFGRTVIESQASGSPAITTDWGGFTETVVQGKTGFRCKSFQDFIEAVEKVKDLDPAVCRKWALENFSIDKVKYMYQDYLEKLCDLNSKGGWYSLRKDRVAKPLKWLNKWYPS